mgnify:FL=1
MFGRRFNSFSNRFNARGSRFAVNESAMSNFSCNSARTENMASLLSMDTALAVSIFAALRLIIIRLVSLIVGIIAVVPADIGTLKRPALA